MGLNDPSVLGAAQGVSGAPVDPLAEPIVAAPAKGGLLVQTRPWAKVEIDGREAGVTPLNAPIKLTAGMHSVKMSNSDLGKEITRQIEIIAGETKVMKEILDE